MSGQEQGHLALSLAVAVPLHIEKMRKAGGPSEADFAKARSISDALGERGDVLLFGNSHKGEVANLFNGTAHAIACLAFVPGGIDIFGQHFEATK